MPQNPIAKQVYPPGDGRASPQSFMEHRQVGDEPGIVKGEGRKKIWGLRGKAQISETTGFLLRAFQKFIAGSVELFGPHLRLRHKLLSQMRHSIGMIALDPMFIGLEHLLFGGIFS